MDERTQIFKQIKTLMQAYSPPLTSKIDDDAHFDLWSIKDLVIEGRKRKEVYLAGLVIQKRYVAFYFMPVYAKPEIKPFIPAELLKMLKGKSCFHVNKMDDTLLAQISALLKMGFEMYQKNGWV